MADGSDAALAQLIRPRARGRRAHRLTPDELPWSSNPVMPNGVEVRLINVSRSGILVESPIKFAPDSATEFHIKGPDTSMIVPARFIRSEVSAVDALGVRYQAAAIFSTKLELFPAEQRPTSMAAAPQALAELLVRVTTELNEGASPDMIRATFEQGLRRLVPACDVRLRHTPAGSLDGCDSITSRSRRPVARAPCCKRRSIPSTSLFSKSSSFFVRRRRSLPSSCSTKEARSGG